MKTRIVLLLCLFISFSFLSCKREKHTEYHENGNLKSVFYTRNHKFVGKTVGYYENGFILEEGQFMFNRQFGLWINYYPNGDVMCRRRYLFGKLVSINAWAKDGTQTIVDGTGIMTGYYKSGMVSCISSYKNNRLDGEVSSWYENGFKELESFYKYGVPVGVTKHWNEKGELEYTREYSYSNDTACCVDKFYYPNGSLQKEEHSCNKTQKIFTKGWAETGELVYEKEIDAYWLR